MKRRSEDTKKSKTVWTAAEDDALMKAVLQDQRDRETQGEAEDEEDWDEIAKVLPGKTPVQCLKRYMILNRKKKSKEIAAAAANAVARASPATKPTAKQVDHEDQEDDDDHEEEEEEEEEEDQDETVGGKEGKRSRKEGDSASFWPQDEIDLLKKLVEQYKDSTYTYQQELLFLLTITEDGLGLNDLTFFSYV
jgi:hypothetical protein